MHLRGTQAHENGPGRSRSPTHRLRIPETCGRCHFDRERMRPYGIPIDQVAEYRRGIHGLTLLGKLAGVEPDRAPTCIDCHGGHGSTPPETGKLHAVCGTCHSTEHRYFKAGPHYGASKQVRVPGCVDCHGSHRNTLPAVGLLDRRGQGDCGACHRQGELAYRVALELQEIRKRAAAVVKEFQAKKATEGSPIPALTRTGQDPAAPILVAQAPTESGIIAIAIPLGWRPS